jgi:hypothetical protein
MKTHVLNKIKRVNKILFFLILINLTNSLQASPNVIKPNQQDTTGFVQYKGSVTDRESKNPLVFATISVSGTNIATISNSEGVFLLKVPKNLVNAKVTVSYIGYRSKQFSLSDFRPENNRIELEMQNVNLKEITVFPRDPELLMRAIMNKIGQNYTKDPLLMTAFYREAIKKRRTYVSLSEAVVEIVKQPYLSARGDYAQIYKGRKSTDYNKLDTLVFKLQGGPYTNLMLDIMKNPEMIFTEDMIGNYQFTLNDITKIDDRLTYIIRFRQWPHLKNPLYYGELYIDTETLALTGALFDLNVEDRDAASQMFIKKKPVGARVYPTSAQYRVDYREKDGRWYMGYSRGQITFKVIWNKKLFNTVYESTIEMLVTDWQKLAENPVNPAERLKPTVIMADEISGFADPEFWGDYNVIEPEKSIETAIKKIQKSLEKKNR